MVKVADGIDKAIEKRVTWIDIMRFTHEGIGVAVVEEDMLVEAEKQLRYVV